jgi:hypothetical protein
MSAADATPGTTTGVTPALKAGERTTPTCGPSGLKTNAITYSRTLHVGQPYGGLRLGRFRSDLTPNW